MSKSDKQADRIYTMSAREALRIKRGAFLPALLILPMAAMFGFDRSKSQPMHFLMVFSVALCLAAAVVTISRYGAKRRIAEFSKTRLKITEKEIQWSSTLGETVLPFAEIDGLRIHKVRGDVRSITLTRNGGGQTVLEGYDSMNDIATRISAGVSTEADSSNSWFGL